VPAIQPGAAPAVVLTAHHIDSQTAKVTGATAPFEFVLGQSVDTGWQAQAIPGPGAAAGSHAVALGGSQLVDGFANGWHLTAADLHALGGSSFTVVLTWTPQKDVWLALAVSGATLLLCLVLCFLPAGVRRRMVAWTRRRVRVRRRHAHLDADNVHDEFEPVTVDPAAPPLAAVPLVVVSSPPALTMPLLRDRSETVRKVRWWAIVPLGLLTGGAAAAVTSGRAGLVVAALVILGLCLPRLRVLPAVAGIGFVVAGCLNVVLGQYRHHYLPGSNWAGSFVHAGNLVWLGVVLLLADAVIAAFAYRPRGDGDEEDRDEEDEESQASEPEPEPSVPG
jgi:hypothetical protein